MRRRKRKNPKKIRKIVVSRGGIQLVVAFAIGSCLAGAHACTIKHKLLPTTISVDSMEIVSDSIDSSDLFYFLNSD